MLSDVASIVCSRFAESSLFEKSDMSTRMAGAQACRGLEVTAPSQLAAAASQKMGSLDSDPR
jgi:hypothetical protein